MNWLIAGCHCCQGFIFFVFGGQISGGFRIKDTDKFSKSSAAWSAMSDMPDPARSLHDGVDISGTGYIFCGQGSPSFQDNNDSYVVDTWTSKTDVPTARAFPAAGKIGSLAYVIKGQTASATYTNVNEEYDPSGDSWDTKASMPSPDRREGAGRFSIDSGVFVFGGRDSGTTTTGQNDKYESAGDSWSSYTDSDSSVVGMSSMSIGEKGVSVAGGTLSGTPGDAVSAFDALTDSWTAKTSIGYSHFQSQSVGGTSSGHTCGGVSGSSVLGDHEFFDLDADLWTATTSMPSPNRYIAASLSGIL